MNATFSAQRSTFVGLKLHSIDANKSIRFLCVAGLLLLSNSRRDTTIVQIKKSRINRMQMTIAIHVGDCLRNREKKYHFFPNFRLRYHFPYNRKRCALLAHQFCVRLAFNVRRVHAMMPTCFEQKRRLHSTKTEIKFWFKWFLRCRSLFCTSESDAIGGTAYVPILSALQQQ